MNKTEDLRRLNTAWRECQRCELCRTRHNVVPGEGNANALKLIVGEAPGENEDLEGRPFVGLAGQILDACIISQGEASAKIVAAGDDASRARTVEERSRRFGYLRDLLSDEYYYANSVACRPPNNRDPTPAELEACHPWLMELIYIVDPALIIASGGVALSALIGRAAQITKVRGELYDIEVQGRVIKYRVPVLATLHPSYLSRKNDFNDKEGEAAKTYRHFIRAGRIVDLYNKFHCGFEPLPRPYRPDEV